MPYFSDQALTAAVEAMKPDRIQGFTYGTEHVIRDVYRPWEAQVLWRGPASDEAAFDRQCEIERLRIGFAAAAKVHEQGREIEGEIIAPLTFGGEECLCRDGLEATCQAIGCPRQNRASPSPLPTPSGA